MAEVPNTIVHSEQFSTIANPTEATHGVSRRLLLAAAVASAATASLAAACGGNRSNNAPAPSSNAPESHAASPEATRSAEEQFLLEAADSLLSLGVAEGDTLRFKSQIQSPHNQTDRDVGAASVGMGFLAMATKYPDDPKWLGAAAKTANWLTSVANTSTASDGSTELSWPDYVDGSDRASSTYTSFDDGALGIGDFFWRLYEHTNDPNHKAAAISTVNWTLSQAENVGQGQDAYRWLWDISTKNNAPGSDNGPVYYMGMGEGVTGIVHTLATYHERTNQTDPAFAAKCKTYIDGSLRYLQQVRDALGSNDGDSRALPETGVIGQDGDTSMNSGYLSGAAGTAMMYLKLHQVFGDNEYLAKADELFDWLENKNLQDGEEGPLVDFGDGTAAWKLMIDPQGGDDPKYATGIEEGAAGIGWVYLQANKLTGDEKYITMARKAADWLAKVAIRDDKGGWSWHEDENSSDAALIRPNLNNGAAGIGTFFYDLYEVTNEPNYLAAAKGAQTWLMNSVVHTRNNIGWEDNDEGNRYSNDPSWHWGYAGIIAFIARVNGGSMDIAGEQDALAAKK